MGNLSAMLWIETRKAFRSRMPLWTALGSLLMPFGIAFLIFVAKNPQISQKLGLVSAKANLLAYSATDWAAYLGFFGMLVAAGGFFLYVLIISWVFGREFTDGTLKDMLAVPVQRFSIVLSKFILVAVWSVALTLLMFAASFFAGALIRLPGGSPEAILQGSLAGLLTALMTIWVVMPFALFASLGRGYLLPLGMAVLTLMLTNLVVVIGRGEYFPWAVVGLYVQGKESLPAISYVIVILTGFLGILATYLWWKYADQNR